MKKIFYVLIFSSFAIFSEAFAADNATEKKCRDMMPVPDVEIVASYGKLRYDFSKNNRSLTRMHLRQYGCHIAPGQYVHGLATFELVSEVSFTINENTLGDGTVCVYPGNIVLSLGLQNPTIYISKDLREGSCVYQLALRHEQTHQQINQEVFESYLPIIKSRFLETVKANMLFSGRNEVDIETVREELKEHYFSVLNPIIKELKREISIEQAKLDSVENYDYEQSICNIRKKKRR